MKFGVSNIALPSFDHALLLHKIAELGFTGLEVAPSRVWLNTSQGLDPKNVEAYRKIVEGSGLQVIGLHSLFFDHPELGLFKGDQTRKQTLEFLSHLSAVCRDLGGRTLIYGGGRRRGDVPLKAAKHEAIDFMGDLAQLISDHGTCFCFEPLGPNDTDFIHTIQDSLEIVLAVNSPTLKIQVDVKALVANRELACKPLEAAGEHLTHVHVNEPGFVTLGSTGDIDHAMFGALLRQIEYNGYVSIEQKLMNEINPIADIETGLNILRTHYQLG